MIRIAKNKIRTISSSNNMIYNKLRLAVLKYFDIENRMVNNGKFYRLYRPYFIYNSRKKKVDVVDIPLYFRKNFIVCGGRNSIYGLVSLNNLKTE